MSNPTESHRRKCYATRHSPGSIRQGIGVLGAMRALLYSWTYPLVLKHGYGSIPINTIFRGMNIHLPAILMFTRGTRFWPTAKWQSSCILFPSENIPFLRAYSLTLGYAAKGKKPWNGIMASEAATTSWVKAWCWMSPTPSRPLLPSTNWRLEEGEKALNQWPHDETIQFIEIYCRICHLTSSIPYTSFYPKLNYYLNLKSLNRFFFEDFWSHGFFSLFF